MTSSIVRRLLGVGLAAISAVAVAVVAPAAAQAAPAKITVYAGLKITPTTEYPGWCTLGAVGYDTYGNAIGLTAGHCTPNGNDPAPVPMYAYNDKDAGVLGTIVQIDHRTDHDWSVIKFDPAKVTLSNTAPNGYRIDSIGTPRSSGTVVCQNGATSGIKCGAVVGILPEIIGSTTFLQEGDSGGPLSQDGVLVGLNDRIWFPDILRVGSPYVSININQVVSDINAIGKEGTGFTPVKTAA